MHPSLKSLIEMRDVTKTFPSATGGFTALHDVSLSVSEGSFAAVLGQSGSGKSTLLGMLAGIDRPTSGTVRVGATALESMTERSMSGWRGRAVGIVFQFFQLLPTLTAIENVMLPMDFCNRWPADERVDRAHALLDRLGVADQARKLPSTLSGGQQQRVAIARALANAPQVLLADEPTGNLDSRTSAAIFELFASLVHDGQTVVMVTHERTVATFATQVITLADGRIVEPHVAAHA